MSPVLCLGIKFPRYHEWKESTCVNVPSAHSLAHFLSLPASLPLSPSLLRLVKVGYADGPAARPPKEKERDREVRGGVPPVHLPAAKMQLQGPPVRLVLCKNKFGLGRFIQAQKGFQTIPVRFEWDLLRQLL